MDLVLRGTITKEKPVPTVMINTEDARERLIENGDLVHIKTERGVVGMYAHVTDDIVQGAIEASGTGGRAIGPKKWQEACINDLTDLRRYDPISGFPVYKALLCDVIKATEGAKCEITGIGEYTPDKAVEKRVREKRIYLDNKRHNPLEHGCKGDQDQPPG
jgi:predicted molibdopterin-dependent oxidoreductase YjgC